VQVGTRPGHSVLSRVALTTHTNGPGRVPNLHKNLLRPKLRQSLFLVVIPVGPASLKCPDMWAQPGVPGKLPKHDCTDKTHTPRALTYSEATKIVVITFHGWL